MAFHSLFKLYKLEQNVHLRFSVTAAYGSGNICRVADKTREGLSMQRRIVQIWWC